MYLPLILILILVLVLVLIFFKQNHIEKLSSFTAKITEEEPYKIYYEKCMIELTNCAKKLESNELVIKDDPRLHYVLLGYLSHNTDQYPVYGRWYRDRSDKWEYYTIDDSRNRVKIPFHLKNYMELFDGETIDLPEIGTNLKFVKYEQTKYIYNPNKINF